MMGLEAFARFLGRGALRRSVEREVCEEIRFHLEMLADEQKQKGVSDDAAWREAVRVFGERTEVEEQCRRLTARHSTRKWRSVVMGGWIQDLRLVFRSLRRAPGFTAVTALTLALGIGANTAIFSVVNGVILRPLPYDSPEELVLISHRFSEGDVVSPAMAGPDYIAYRDQADLFEDLLATFSVDTNITGDGDAEAAVISWVTPSFFDFLGVDVAIGRGFTEEDVVRIDPRVFQDPNITPPALATVLSNDLWQRRYAADPDVVGRTLQINGQTMTVIGIAPAGFRLHLPADAAMPTNIDIWTLWPFELASMPPTNEFVTVLGRIRDEATVDQAEAQMATVMQGLREGNPRHAQRGTEVVLRPLQTEATAHVRPVLLVLFGTVGFVLLIACANVANLLLVRAATREKEIAIRTALGSGRAEIARQMFTESLVLALLGAAAGLALSAIGVDALLALTPESLPRVQEVGIDGSVLGFTLLATVGAALLFGMAPFIQSGRMAPSDALRERSGTATRKRHRVRGSLIVVQVAVSVVLLVGAGLMLRSFNGLAAIDPGFEDDDLVTFRFALPVFAYRTDEQRQAFFKALHTELKARPELTAVGAVMPIPLVEQATGTVSGYTRIPGDTEDYGRHQADYRGVLPGYFDIMGISLVSGRVFDEVDDDNALGAPVVMIDEKMAAEAFPGEDPIGQMVYMWAPSQFGGVSSLQAAQVIGIVENVRSASLAELGRPAIYHPYSYSKNARLDFVVKSAMPLGELAPLIRETVRSVGADVPVQDLRPMRFYVDNALASSRFAMTLLGIFAGVALLLAAVGLYGVLAYNVRERTHEVGVRMALGAARETVIRMILRQGLSLTLAGVLIGLIGAVALGDVMTGLLFGVSATDPVTYVGISAVLALAAVVACLVPAMRASRVEPSTALRSE